jgi:hypothetical protein
MKKLGKAKTAPPRTNTVEPPRKGWFQGMEFRPLDKRAFTTPEAFHELVEVIPPEEQAKRFPVEEADLPGLSEAARLLAERLVANGPRQHGGELPHFETFTLLQITLRRLRDHALAGDGDAFNLLGYLLEESIRDFHEVARKQPEIAKKWGRTRVAMPVIFGRTESHGKEAAEILDLFELGKKAKIRACPSKKRGGRSVDIRSPITSLAAGLIKHLELHRWKKSLERWIEPPIPGWVRLAWELPDFNKTNVEAWIKAALELVDASFEHDEELVKYCPLGDVRGGETTTGTASQKASIRARIRRAIKTLAPD